MFERIQNNNKKKQCGMEYIKWINEQYAFILLSYNPFFALSFIGVFRLMVSASQDGKLLIWDSHSGNKVRLT